MSIVVQKFGGSSLATCAGREAAVVRVLAARAQGAQVVVVVSAMGRQGAPYATDTLKALINSEVSLNNKRDLDLLLSCGEIISAAVLGHLLRQKLPRVACLTGGQAGIITDEAYGDARIIEVRPQKPRSLLQTGHVVVVAGFQGVSATGEITTLGRSGSDITAAALGVALKASRVEIYTDVDGIATADPKLTPGARVLTWLDYATALQLSEQGAKVLHPHAVATLQGHRIPLMVRNTCGHHPGTRIIPGLRAETPAH